MTGQVCVTYGAAMITHRIWQWRRVFTVMAAAGLVIAATIGAGSASANTNQQQYLTFTPQWCATTTGNSPYAAIVLGACNSSAGSQQFYTRNGPGNTFEIVNLVNNLCDTYNAPNGAPDGTPIIEGNCADAVTQLWQAYDPGGGGRVYYLPARRDNHGNYIAMDDANDVLKPYNKIDGSFFAPGYNSERWSFFG